MGPNSTTGTAATAIASAAETVLGDAERVGDAFHSIVDRLKTVRATVAPALAHPLVPKSLGDAFSELLSIVGDIHQAVAELLRPCECAEAAPAPAPAPTPAAEPEPASLAGLTVTESAPTQNAVILPAEQFAAFQAWQASQPQTATGQGVVMNRTAPGAQAGADARAAQDAVNGQAQG